MNCPIGVLELQEFPIIMTLYVVVSVFSYSPIPFPPFIYFYHLLLIMLFPNSSFYFYFTIYSFPSILPFISFSYLIKILLLSVPLKQTFTIFSFLVTSTDVIYSALNEYSLIYLEENCSRTNISPSFNQHG